MGKYKALMLVMFFLSVFCFSRVNANVRDYSLLGRCIYLDAGHGGVDSGAISNTFLEKDMNLILVNKLANKLFERGAMVFLTRDGDYDLSTSTINRKRNDLYNRVEKWYDNTSTYGEQFVYKVPYNIPYYQNITF